MTVHFVYNKGLALKTPDRILHELSRRLARHFPVRTYAINEIGTLRPEAGDVLIGHPSRYSPNSFYNRSFWQPGWAKRIVFCPFSHGMPRDAAVIDPLVEAADHHLALCGPHWFETMADSLVSHWQYKTMRCDLGIDLDDYPRIKHSFNPPGRRKFLYIGNAGPMKGGDIFARLARANPDMGFGWIGWFGPEQRPPGTLRREYTAVERSLRSGHVKVHGGADWRDPAALATIADYDFLLTCGRSDSNPTTILEATAWGLIPIAPIECGYYGDAWLINVPLNDIADASAVLRRLNEAPGAELIARQSAGLERITRDYSWDHAAQQVIDCIVAPCPTMPTDPAWHARKAKNRCELGRIAHNYARAQKIEDTLFAASHPLKTIRHVVERHALGRSIVARVRRT